ncbi:MAG: hypothetical protein Q7S78_01250 [Candidatus Azambacteria bacterium]|nr:hypothetical protein [Candidatus Azambacteria bacterium]
MKNFVITNEKSQDSASVSAHQLGDAAVVTLSHTVVPGITSCLGESNSALLTSKLANKADLWTLKVSDLEGFESLTYADTGIVDALLSTGVIFYSDILPKEVFGISLPSFVPNQEKAILSYIASVLREHGHFATVIISDSPNDDSKTLDL